jgi:hypothetical protein
MISDFEQRLADVLGGRLPAPFTGHAQVAPAGAAGVDPAVVVRVESALPLASGMGGEAQQVVPGSATPRRVVRLACTVEITVVAAGGSGRDQQVHGLDAALYVLDAPDFRNGAALSGGAPDPGFLIRSMRLRALETPPVLLPSGTREDRAALIFDADGLFWPIGTAGAAGVAIEDVRIRGAITPVALIPSAPRIFAGGDPVDLALRVREGIRNADGTPTSLILRLVGPGGGPGAGSLAGAVNGLLAVDIVDSEALFTYTPGGTPARLELVVALDNGASGIGLELERFALVVEEAP